MNHFEINEETRLSVSIKKHEARKRKFKGKTKAQRLKSTFYILTTVWIVSQFISATLASTGILHYFSTKLNGNSFLIIMFTILGLLFLEFCFNKLNSDFHSQLHDDKEVQPITVGLIAVFGVFYVGSTYFGTGYAVSFFSASPDYHNIEQISLKHDNLINKEAASTNFAALIADKKKQQKELKDVKYRGNTTKTAQKTIEAIQKEVNILTMQSSDQSKFVLENKKQLKLKKELDIKERKLENRKMKEEHSAFCSSFGETLSIVSIFSVLIFLLSFSWCQWFIRFETEENETILSKIPKESPKKGQQEQSKRTYKEPIKKQEPLFQPLKEQEKELHPIGFGKKEGAVVVLDGKEFILLEMKKGKNKGKLVRKSKSEFKNLINNQSSSERIEYLTGLLQNFK